MSVAETAAVSRVRPSEYPKSGLYWHVHHDVLCEYVWDVDERWQAIIGNKPEAEIDTRLRWFRPVLNVPERLDRARAEWDKARAEWDKACAEWYKARAECLPDLEALHAVECPGCPWDGTTLFPWGAT